MHLFHINKGFSLVNISQKSGLFCQMFTSTILPKTIPIYSGQLNEYSATIDINEKIHVAVLSDRTHLHYYYYDNNRFVGRPLISNPGSNFELSCPCIYTYNNIPYVTYVSHQVFASCYHVVCENLQHSTSNILLELNAQPTHFKVYETDDVVTIFFTYKDTQYHLNALVVTQNGVRHVSYLTSNDAIVDYSVCMAEDRMHIAFETEVHGKYQLSYVNTMDKKIVNLYSLQTSSIPAVFCYYDLVWIHAMVSQKVQIFLSMNNGNTFSIPTPCTLQTNLSRSYFRTRLKSAFVGQEVYVSLCPKPKICSIASIDIPHFHPDTRIPAELELLLEGLSLKLDSIADATQSVTPPPPEPDTPNDTPTTQPLYPSDTPTTQPLYPNNPPLDPDYQQPSPNPWQQGQSQGNQNPWQQGQSQGNQNPWQQGNQNPWQPKPPQGNQNPWQQGPPQGPPPPPPNPWQQGPPQGPPPPPPNPFARYSSDPNAFLFAPERPYTTSPSEEEENALEAATEAFMDDNFNGWDLPPMV